MCVCVHAGELFFHLEFSSSLSEKLYEFGDFFHIPEYLENGECNISLSLYLSIRFDNICIRK